MEKQYYVLDLKDDPVLIERYKQWHTPAQVPPAITESIRAAGIEGLEIFACGNRLMMVLTPGPQFDAQAKARADAANPEVQAWETLMWTFQQALPFAQAGQKWVPMERIFDLSAQE